MRADARVWVQPLKAWEIRGDNGGEKDNSPETSFKMDQLCLRPDCFIQTTKKETIQDGFAKWEFSAGADGILIIKQEQKTVLLMEVFNFYFYSFKILFHFYFLHIVFFFCFTWATVSIKKTILPVDCWTDSADKQPRSQKSSESCWQTNTACLIVAWFRRFGSLEKH